MMKSKADEEEYWNSSKFKAFTFDDEDDEFSRLKESKQAVNSIRCLVEEDDDEDDVEKVSWSGEPVGSISWSVRETAATNQKTDREPAFPRINTDTPTCQQEQLWILSELSVQRALGRTEDMALLQYKEHLSIADENKRRDFLKSCLSLPFSAEDSAHVQDHYTVLERQIIIEATDRQAERGGKVEIFQKFPRRASILNMPLITTLYYSCFYHYTEPEGTYSSPLNIRQTFKISEKQYFVTALAARAKLKAWSDVDCSVHQQELARLHQEEITAQLPTSRRHPAEELCADTGEGVLQDYVALVDDADIRISLAQKHKCHDIIINTYRDLKDRQMLLGYRGKVERGSVEERKIDELLNNLVRKKR
ncbi:Spermatogenesis-defective protein 39-like protein, partial [Nibea albiflora]